MKITAPEITVEMAEKFSENDLADMCDAPESAILEDGWFGWPTPPPRQMLERRCAGVLSVPERELFQGREDEVTAGSAQLVKPQRNNEAMDFAASIATNFVAPWARGYGLAWMLTLAVEDAARAHEFSILDLDVSAHQAAAIQLYELLGCLCWGANPTYAIADGRVVACDCHSKKLGLSPDGAEGTVKP